MKKGKIIIVAIITILIIGVICTISSQKEKEDYNFKVIQSEKDFKKIYTLEDYKEDTYKLYLTLPFSIIYMINRPIASVSSSWDGGMYYDRMGASDASSNLSMKSTSETTGISAQKDFSTTNIQVENVDEADIIKTDGNFIYSISEDKVIITDVQNKEEPKILSKITLTNSAVPEDILLYKDKLIVIGSQPYNSREYYYYNYNYSTVVNVFDISDKEKPKIEKNYQTDDRYYTSRLIDGKLYIISAGYLKQDNNNDYIRPAYTENGQTKEIAYNNMKYIPSMKTRDITTIASLDLAKSETDATVKSYFINVSNAYVAEDNMYLVSQEYNYSSYYEEPEISDIFGLLGIFGAFVEDDYNYNTSSSYYETKIFKFKIDGTNIEFVGLGKEGGQTLDQFSLDQYNNNLRVALDDTSGTKVVVFNENMDKIGEVDKIAPGENMYSSRFVGDKVYLVTYQTIDPLFVIDLKEPTSPKILGELKIPGYSTYLHPYDENHIIGIGMETKETINRDINGRVTSTTASIVGMKMALFDVSDVKNPKELSNIVIGDSRATSSVLTNHKALLFSKEKNLIAIPVNNYDSDFEIAETTDIQSVINSFNVKSNSYISEGYLVYDLTLQDGFKLKGVITHDLAESNINSYYRQMSHMLRGLYIENDLYTVSETKIMVNALSDLSLISELRIINK